MTKTTMTLSVPDGEGGTITTGPFTQSQLEKAVKQIKKGPPMKHDNDFAKQAEHAYRVTDFKDTYLCPDCHRRVQPISGEYRIHQWFKGWHVTCPVCDFSISGRSKTTVLQHLSVLASRVERIDELMEGKAT